MKNEAIKEPSRLNKTPVCEVCHKKPAVSFSFFFQDLSHGYGGEWKFCCDGTCEEEDYYISVNDFFSAQAEWLKHLEEKRWMDWGNWHVMMKRFLDEAEQVNPPNELESAGTEEPAKKGTTTWACIAV